MVGLGKILIKRARMVGGQAQVLLKEMWAVTAGPRTIWRCPRLERAKVSVVHITSSGQREVNSEHHAEPVQN